MDLLEQRHTKGFAGVQIGPIAAKGLAYLDPAERKLVEMVLSGRMSRREIAVLTGVPIQTVSRRMIRIVTRLHDPLVIALIEHGQLLPEGHRDLGLAYYLRRWGPTQICREYGVTEYALRKVLTYIKGWHAARRSAR
ncbi:MAG TPA: hypothetical protein VEA69_21465 [Tepidisphaeraceae bacterium]|nr:hypothetical protein [Tepidisphaeraceae bacterium]